MTRLFTLLCATALAARAALPAYVTEALARYSPVLPAGLACSVETRRNNLSSVERFDPSLPAGAQWRLVTLNGAQPSADDYAAYVRRRGQTAEPPYRSAFTPDQLDLATFRVLNETPATARVGLGFSEAAARGDKMLPQLEVELLIARQPARIVSYRMRLPRPFHPVIGVKMQSLEAGADFDETGRPVRQFSRFTGTMFLFKSIDEQIDTRFFDYAAMTIPTATAADPARTSGSP